MLGPTRWQVKLGEVSDVTPCVAMPPIQPTRMQRALVGFSRSRWARPFQWMRDEKFWRDVATQAIGGAIVVTAGYLFGLGAGTIPPPTNKNIMFDVVVVIGAFVVSFVAAGGFRFLLSAGFRGPHDGFARAIWAGRPRRQKVAFFIGGCIPWLIWAGGTVGLSYLVLHWFSP